MLGWLWLGSRYGRARERRRLEAQAERQRLRAPEPTGWEALPEPPRYRSRRRNQEAEAVSWFCRWVVLPLLIMVCILTGNWTIFFVGLLATILVAGVYVALVRD